MKFLAALLVICLFAALPTKTLGQSQNADFEKRKREMKAEHDRRVAELKRKASQQQRQSSLAPSLTPSSRNRNNPLASQSPPTPPSANGRPQASTAPLNASAAGSPAKALAAYVQGTKTANSMEAVLKYLPEGEQKSLKEYQATYDPNLAADKRKRFQKDNPKLDKESLDHLTNPPYVNALKFHKRVAGKILEVLDVDIQENRANVKVAILSDTVINGTRYPYGTANVGMVAERNTWKFDTFKENEIVYLDRPTPKE